MNPYTCPPSSSAKITSSGLMRSAWENTVGATTWPSICCSAVKAMVSHTASSGSPLNSAMSTGGAAPIAGPTYGISSANPYHAPKKIAYVLPSGNTPSDPITHSSNPALVPMISENRNCPRT
jgi:hypothetical protein